MSKITPQDFINFYIIAIPLTLMIHFTVHAIIYKGTWIIDMTQYGEYQLEVLMFGIWFALVLFRGKYFYNNIMK
jgi:uncharacterized protein YhhL (DUF1145 family)